MADAQTPAEGDEKGERLQEPGGPRKGRQGRRETPGGGDAVVATGPAVDDEAPEGKRKRSDRGRLSPAQYEDDGWGDVPVQMRG